MRYKTTLQYARIEYIEKKSKFITSVKPVKSEEEAIEFINSIKKEFYDARHNVFAYQIGERNEIQRYSDDGEPSGTSGPPTLDVLKNNDIKNTVIVTTRYFGGILLGTGGLVRAYGKSATLGLEEAKIVENILFDKISLTFNYTLFGKISYLVNDKNYNVLDTIYMDLVEYIIIVPKEESAAFVEELIDYTNNNININFLEEAYYTLCDGKILF